MGRLNIPKKHEISVELIIKHSIEDLNHVANKISTIQIGADIDEKLDEIENESQRLLAKQLVPFLVSVSTMRFSIGKTPSETFVLIANALEDQFEFSAKKLELWNDRKALILSMLESSFVSLKGAARSAYGSGAAVLSSFDILVDLRPLFESLNESSTSFITTNTINFVYREGSSINDIYLKLDSKDLEDLRDKCDLALRRIEMLENSVDLKVIPQDAI